MTSHINYLNNHSFNQLEVVRLFSIAGQAFKVKAKTFNTVTSYFYSTTLS
jgi:hypothetical protein